MMGNERKMSLSWRICLTLYTSLISIQMLLRRLHYRSLVGANWSTFFSIMADECVQGFNAGLPPIPFGYGHSHN